MCIRDRHCDWFLGWLDGTPLEGLVHDLATITAVGLQIDNFRAAADWCQANDWPDRLARLATRMYGYWWLGGAGLALEIDRIGGRGARGPALVAASP